MYQKLKHAWAPVTLTCLCMWLWLTISLGVFSEKCESHIVYEFCSAKCESHFCFRIFFGKVRITYLFRSFSEMCKSHIVYEFFFGKVRIPFFLGFFGKVRIAYLFMSFSEMCESHILTLDRQGFAVLQWIGKVTYNADVAQMRYKIHSNPRVTPTRERQRVGRHHVCRAYKPTTTLHVTMRGPTHNGIRMPTAYWIGDNTLGIGLCSTGSPKHQLLYNNDLLQQCSIPASDPLRGSSSEPVDVF